VPRTATPASPPATFDAALDEFFGALRRGRARAAAQVGAGELTQSQFQLLGAFTDADERNVGELAEAASVAAPTATRMLDGLERSGIVERRPSEADRRAVTVRLTPKGKRLVERRRKLSIEKRRALYESLTPSERRQVERLLSRLAAVMEEL
jgi:MarR family transcriptional regulator, organic hydroperoxide resistance regulator